MTILLELEHEVGVLIRRVKRVIGERARDRPPRPEPAGYLMLAHLIDTGPLRASALSRRSTSTRVRSAGRCRRLVDLGLVERTAGPRRRPRDLVVASATRAAQRLADGCRARRERLDERLGDWTDDELGSFVATLGRYNASPATLTGPDESAQREPDRRVRRAARPRPARSRSRPRRRAAATARRAAVEHDGQRRRAGRRARRRRASSSSTSTPAGVQANVAAAERLAVELQRRAGAAGLRLDGERRPSRPAVGSTAASRPARSRTAPASPPHGIGTRQPSRPTSPVRNQAGSWRSSGATSTCSRPSSSPW